MKQKLSVVALALCCARPAFGLEQETEIPGVTASIVEARQYDGILHLGVELRNAGTAATAPRKALMYSDLVLLDRSTNRKYYPLKDSAGHMLAGPVSDWSAGGRWFPKLSPESQTLIWALFDAVPAGDTLTLEAPYLQPMDFAVVNAPPSRNEIRVASVPPLQATLVSAERVGRDLRVRLKVDNPGRLRSAQRVLDYRDVYLLDPIGKRSYPLVRGRDGLYLAHPLSDRHGGGRWLLARVEPGTQSFVDLTFAAPPETVHAVDIIVPGFGPFEVADIPGERHVTASDAPVTGRSAEVQRALQELHANITPQQINIDLSADVLFDFDSTQIKPEAAPSLAKVATVLQSFPDAQVDIDGYTDSKGSDEYNQALSEKRAAAVEQWLAAYGGLDTAYVHARGFGKSNPVAPNTNPDGTDNPEGRAQNRRVEIVVAKPGQS